MAAVGFLTSCGGGVRKDFNVDVSGINADVEVVRFDLDFDTIQPQNVYSVLPALTAKYGDFLDFYIRGIINLPAMEDADFQTQYTLFANYCKTHYNYREVEKVFPADEPLEPLFEDAFRHFRYYFPGEELPKIYTIISGYQESMFPTDGIVAVALDKYHGNSGVYADHGFENYRRHKMVKAMIPVDFFRTYALVNYPHSDDNADNLLNEMVYQGRVQYFLKSMMPSAPDSLLWGYTDINYCWAEAYEENVWNYLIDRKLLFITDTKLINNFTGEGPFTKAFGNESAPGVASFCGYGIVCSYMANHPEVTLHQLMEITDLQSIYNTARYNP